MTWEDQALDNEREWGSQSIETLLLALGEEYGELVQSYLEWKFEDGDADRIQAELDDTMALGYQLDWRLEELEMHREDPRCIDCGLPIDRHRHDYKKTERGFIHEPNCGL